MELSLEEQGEELFNGKSLDDITLDDVEEFKKALEIEEDVSGQLITDEKTFVTIIPTSDFLNNQTYYYNHKLLHQLIEY